MLNSRDMWNIKTTVAYAQTYRNTLRGIKSSPEDVRHLLLLAEEANRRGNRMATVYFTQMALDYSIEEYQKSQQSVQRLPSETVV